MTDRTLAATPEQLFAGLPVASQAHVQCQRCGDVLYEGTTITLLAARPADSHTWTLQRVCCTECTTEEIRHPTLGYTELRVRCRLGTRTDCATQYTQLVVLDPTVLATSLPTDCDEPTPTETNRDTETDHPDSDQESTTTQHTSPEDLEMPHGR